MIYMNDEIQARIAREGESAYPEETCGFLIGVHQKGIFEVYDLYPVSNAQVGNARRRRYLITPKDYLEAEARAFRQGWEVVGTYHSHPDHPARPSATDLAEATFPDFAYVIVQITQGQAQALTAWVLADDRSKFFPIPIVKVKPEEAL